MSDSEPLSTLRPPRAYAAGIHSSDERRTYLFKDVRVGDRSAQYIAIGSGTHCQIVLQNERVSTLHAGLTAEHNAMWLESLSSSDDTYIDGIRVVEPVALVVGMVIQLADSTLVATDEHKMFPIWAHTVSELCREAARLYGSQRLAAKRIGRSNHFVNRQFIPRGQRYTRNSKESR